MAISLIRLINENNLNLPLTKWITKSLQLFDRKGIDHKPTAIQAAQDENLRRRIEETLNQEDEKVVISTRDYIRERLDSYYREQGIRSETVQAVLALNSDDLVDNDRRIRALDTFAAGDNVKNLLASAKRIRNILKKNGERDGAVQTALLQEPAEQALWQAWQDKQPAFEQALAARDYRAALEPLATLGAPLDAFFTDVMVMSDDPALQQNRLTLLTTLQRGFDKIADLSLLSE